MEIDAIHLPLNLIEAYIVKPLKACTTNRPNPMIRNQKVLLPPHEYVFSLRDLRDMEVALASLFLEWPEGGEFAPVLEVYFVRRPPVLVLGEECIL